ncbi:Serine/threonine-protein kinase env7 [Coemansia sp. RSA 1972]|nr:Serine/threonine-protein kinase env7 [Coemansia sp. RSA 1972]
MNAVFDTLYELAASVLTCTNSGAEHLSIGRRQLKFERQLGVGGFSHVYLAHDVDTNEQLAVKKIVCHDGTDALELAYREIDAGQRFQHANIAPLIDHAVHAHPNGSVAYMVFPLYARGTLLDLTQHNAETGEHLSEEFIVQVFRGICRAVQYLHEYRGNGPGEEEYAQGYAQVPQTNSDEMAGGAVHGDIKLANVMLSDDGKTPVLMDFGSARGAHMAAHTRVEALKIQDDAAERCSMPYRAPELFDVQRDAVLDQRTDVWSLGCLLFALAYTFTPFEDPAAGPGASIVLAAVNARYTVPNPNPYSPKLTQLIAFMLEPDPQKRPFIDQVVALTESLYPQ